MQTDDGVDWLLDGTGTLVGTKNETHISFETALIFVWYSAGEAGSETCTYRLY